MKLVASSLGKKHQDLYPVSRRWLKLNDMEFLWEDFLRQKQLEAWDDSERWWPLFLKDYSRGKRTSKLQVLLEVAQFEFYCCWVQKADLGEIQKKDFLQLNPSFQYLSIDAAAQFLSLEAGLYAITQGTDEASVARLGASEALLIDVLAEDRKFNRQSLLEWMNAHHVEEQRDKTWETVLDDLLSKEILVQSK